MNNFSINKLDFKNNNPKSGSYLKHDMTISLETIKRVDKDGFLYEMKCVHDYDTKEFLELVSTLKVRSGCSAFTTYNENDDFVFCRNYDFRHLDFDKNTTGCNLLIKCSPKNKLKSIAICDTFFLRKNIFVKGSLDDNKTDISILAIAPLACVDGINEAGVSAAIFALDTKTQEGENAASQDRGKQKALHSVIVRSILDNAHNVKEAIKIADSFDLVSSSGMDGHIMVADKDGNSVVLEWRQYKGESSCKMYATYTNVVTNFFVGFDDAEDMYYKDGTLREKFVRLDSTWNQYHYGYGHGYHRFSGIVSALDRYINNGSLSINNVFQAKMREEQSKNILSVASQEPGIENTSCTQYSCLYNLKQKTLKLYSQMNYSKSYFFKFNF